MTEGTELHFRVLSKQPQCYGPVPESLGELLGVSCAVYQILPLGGTRCGRIGKREPPVGASSANFLDEANAKPTRICFSGELKLEGFYFLLVTQHFLLLTVDGLHL